MNKAGSGVVWILLAGDGYDGCSAAQYFAAATLGLPTKLGAGRSWLFPASSIKFLTRGSLKSWWVY